MGVAELIAEAQAAPLAVLGALVVLVVLSYVFGVVGDLHSGSPAGELAKCRADLVKMINEKACNPIMVRLAWHDSGTFDKNRDDQEWPAAGGAIGSIQFPKEITAGPNAGLSKALGFLKPIKEAHPTVSWADLIQMGSATAIELAGGPMIDMKYGRVDAEQSPPEGEAPFGLPDALPDFGGPEGCAKDPATHLRWVFGKYGMNDEEIVALSGAHTLGRAFKDRSGTVDNAEGPKGATKFTVGKPTSGCPFFNASGGNYTHNGMAGGRSWTKEWLKFDNSYYQYDALAQEEKDELAWFPTDHVLFTDAEFKTIAELFRDDEKSFFVAYAKAHKKLSELGSKFEPAEGISL